MASRKSFLSRSSYIFPATPEYSETHFNSEGDLLELDEADVWNSSNTVTEAKKGPVFAGSRSVLKRGSKKVEGSGRVMNPVAASSSLPVNIPDWSKILKGDYKKSRASDESGDCDDEEDGGVRIPPHEYLARTRGASLSVHEGIGRTLKGRDLRSVRNAIWKKVGFED